MDPEGFDTKKIPKHLKIVYSIQETKIIFYTQKIKKIKQPTGNWGGPGRSS